MSPRGHRGGQGAAALSLAALLGLSAFGVHAGAETSVTPVAAPAPVAGAPAAGTLRVVSISGGERIDIGLDGSLVDLALARRADGATHVVLLVRPPAAPVPAVTSKPPTIPDLCSPAESERPLRLLRFELDREAPGGRLELLAEGLPGDTVQLAAVDAEGDGTDELLLGRPGEISLMPARAGAPLRSLLGPADLGASMSRVRGGYFVLDRATRTLAVATAEALRFFQFGKDDLPHPAANVALPPASSVIGSGASLRLVLERSGPRFVGHDAEGGALFLSAPELIGQQRIGATLIAPGAAVDAPGPVECWARLPAPERVMESFLRTLDGAPVLIVTAMPADRFSLFGEKRLRVLPLRGDRTRLGHPPLLAVETGANIWQEVVLFVHDVDGDGRADLLLGYWKGLKDSAIALEAYLRREDGSFATRPIKAQFDVEDGDRRQITLAPAPGRESGAVLLALSSEGLLTYPLRTLPRGRGDLVDRRSVRTFARAAGVDTGTQIMVGAGSPPDRVVLSESRKPPVADVVDLDGDGSRELVIRGPATAEWPVSVILPR